MAQYLMTPHVYLCLTDDGIVFLDLKRDKYLGLGGSEVPILGTVVRGWPVCEDSSSSCELGANSNAIKLANALVERGLLTQDHTRGKDAAPTTLEPVVAVLIDGDAADQPSVTIGHLVRFLVACASAWLALRLFSLEHVVRNVEVRKKNARQATSVDIAAARDLVGIFRHLRPFVFTARNACVFDSLALVKFMSQYGLHPSWVFGVKTGPFGAHSWIQSDGFVFNGSVEYVRAFTPIMVI